MTKITTDKNLVTLINVFTVEPENQQLLVDIFVKAGEAMSQQPGFISANIHKSLDGTRVINYVQWRSQEDLAAISQNPETTAHINEIKELAKGNTSLYEVCAICEAKQIEI
ncbi:MAG: antibiotic biosynthesis monooxygenase [Chroococcidiopsidaceae cyanobacterium CP_BM_ER_R8_30]|nr:antibiotic biosynthesis monooxygenase [Chroococcidiopsidaceae cyanobacterium CP_BM_ER_R8_30]